MSRKIGRSEVYLLLFSTVVTVSLALWIIRLFAPTLLGLPADMILVKSNKEAIPFYENVFNRDITKSDKLILEDPFVRVRNQPLTPNIGGIGPNDLLGFRNILIPNNADIIIIGDSQTYGNNAYIWENWPHLLKFYIPEDITIYSMATGGWCALQYVYAFAKSVYFNPRLAIIAFYTGNDPAETYIFARASNLWQEFIPEGIDLDDYDLPKAEFPAPADKQWMVKFPDGTSTIFTPELRDASNKKVKSIDIAYEIMINVSRKIKELADRRGIKIFYTIIPTKEYVYSRKIKQNGIDMDASYKALIEDEADRIESFAKELNKISPGNYIDVADRLLQEVLKPVTLYPGNINGHPLPAGYGIIADEIGKKIKGEFNSKPIGGIYISKTVNELTLPVFVRQGRFWIITGNISGLPEKTGRENLPNLEMRKLYQLEFGGYASVDSLPE